ncbi:ATPase E1-E2 type family protein [Actinidia rufa]|uniref:P-type phospholipid transporter n=1 Tax=Actinidia rufa TaxID=165716 RepID=A0A7J0DY33_9ERIC|nr:ATPase E1-E2 type family protein [Actinidia rufa]
MSGGRKRGIRFSKLYSFSCLKSPFSNEHSQIGKKGYSRVVYCNDLDNQEAAQYNYCGNYVSTTKYTAVNFIPKSLFEQFRRVANIYFLVVACVSFSPLAPYSAISVLAPLVVVIGATMAKEAVEDWRRRKQDIEANNRKVKVYDNKSGTVKETRWKKLRVGDLVKDMYAEETDRPAHARTSNLNEELGQVHTVLSDKTGTLTCNSMEFVKCSIAGTAYGRGMTEVERALARRKEDRQPEDDFTSEDLPRNRVTTQAENPQPILGSIASGLGSYKLLHILEFSSARKRMSVIVRNEENQLLLLCKGADSGMFERLSEKERLFEAETKEHIKKYAEAGLRTLVVAYREIGEEEYRQWEEEFLMAKTSISEDRDELVDAAADRIEGDLILLGATAVEDKLQKGVPECIEKLSNARINIWVLTGDKMETAINIGYACSLLRQGMKAIVITLDSPDINALEKQGDKETIAKASSESVGSQIREGIAQIDSVKESSVTFGLIIDGKSLAFALNKNLEKLFLDLATKCASVICCRSSPKQKALVTRLVKMGTGKTTLSIGDGANDVGMLQEADIGVGISGVEGMQICYFFYKNIAFGFTLFWFEAYASFSGQPAYNDWYMSFYNVFFTSLPVIALGVFDQDVSARLCLKYPMLYQEGVQNILFSWPRILGWMGNGFISSMIIFFFTSHSTIPQAFRNDGQVVDYEVFGATMYTCVVWAVNCQMALSINYFTWIQHLFIWGSIAFWYIFLIIYGSLSPTVSTTAYRVLVEACAPSPFYWLATVLVVVSTLLPYFAYRAFQTRFRPMYHDIIQIRRSLGSETEASGELPLRVEDKLYHLKERLRPRES